MKLKEIEDSIDDSIKDQINRIQLKHQWTKDEDARFLKEKKIFVDKKLLNINIKFFKNHSFNIVYDTSFSSMFQIVDKKSKKRIFNLHVDWNISEVSFDLDQTKISSNDERNISFNRAVDLRDMLKNGLYEDIKKLCEELYVFHKENHLPAINPYKVGEELKKIKTFEGNMFLSRCIKNDITLEFDGPIRFSNIHYYFNKIRFEKVNKKTIDVDLWVDEKAVFSGRLAMKEVQNTLLRHRKNIK